MLLDSQLSARLRSPSPWELAQWRAHPASWEQHLDTAVRCFEDEAAVTEAVNEYLLLFRRNEARRPRSHGAFSETGRLVYYIARNLFSWERSDYVTLVDYGGGDIRVSAFQDKVALVSEGAVAPNARSVDPAHMFSQGTQALQAPATTPYAALNNQDTALFSAASWYQSTIAASNWAPWSNGSSTSFHAVLALGTQAAYGCIIGNKAASSPGVAYAARTGNRLAMYHYSATGTDWTSDPVGSYVYTTNAGIRLDVFVSSAAWSVYAGGSLLASGTPSGTSATTPGATMHIGSDGTGAQTISGRIAELAFRKEQSATVTAAYSRYLYLRYGLT